ncbi:PRC-barrel domain-containing protein [Litchfieldella xinjiangensis]|uniref:PRC-barrel domain-containing protein n=1 Tax=Litchfieldella xinjiangensis TaxID=1166948 RepID=UPI0005BA0F69|nr:PRC-barrel domain-containing protein [Halomonas xinjiangensis]
MKKPITLTLGSLILPAMLAGAAIANEDKSGEQGGDAFMTNQPNNAVNAETLIGSNVETQSGDNENIGTISDLVLNEQGQAQAVVVGVGGFLGIGQKDVALSWDSVELTQEGENGSYTVRSDVDRERLENAPEYETNQAN